ncbi:MAG: hypothetical protein JRJ47_12530 [Deltaproteobacteria bacterium]|nr:hypothetical protein [Deltaproteobacteria bacterium]
MESWIMMPLSVPLLHVVMLLAFNTLALFAGRLRLALLVNYLFALYWGYVSNRELFVGAEIEKLNYFDAAYFGFGLAIVLLASIGFMLRQD